MGISVAGAFCYGLLAAWHGGDYRRICIDDSGTVPGKSARTTQINAPPNDERKKGERFLQTHFGWSALCMSFAQTFPWPFWDS